MQNDMENTKIEAVNEEADAPAEEVRDPEADVEVVGLKFRLTGKTYYFDPQGIKVEVGKFAIVETARGVEIGECVQANHTVKERDIVRPLRPVMRVATEADLRRDAENREKEAKACEICRQKIEALGLEMSLIYAEYTFDNNKLLFYFTAEGRVDFRDLVKELASVFRTRIELRQVGIRDEAKLMGGLGVCGRPFCCHSFLSDFVQVSIKMAKEQNFSLNSAKISGACGRLMCCLRYEHEAYEEEIKKTPEVGSVVETSAGAGIITEINPLAGLVRVKLNDKPEAPRFYPRDEVKIIMTAKQRKAQNALKNGAKPAPAVIEENEADSTEETVVSEVCVTANPSVSLEEKPERPHKKHHKHHKKKPQDRQN